MKTKEYYITDWKTLKSLKDHTYSSHGVPLDHPHDEITDDMKMVFIVEAEDSGHLLFEQHPEVTCLPTVYSPKKLSLEHAALLAKHGIDATHTMMDVSDKLSKVMPTMRHSRF